ncbi:hypothetical protein [Leptolyngbya sp. FACHB-261]|nr:hypothetical protein [Leptolyngbya sp. FACHB-261]MBD2102327.1 hypothetical protein [Leptolyngbya sp. FACHB-261]
MGKDPAHGIEHLQVNGTGIQAGWGSRGPVTKMTNLHLALELIEPLPMR